MDERKFLVKERKKCIDAVKGFCIILVLFAHSGGVPVIGGVLCACYMQVYFILAGLTYTARRDEMFLQFVKRKARRLLKPYFIYATILWIIDSILKRLSAMEILRGGGWNPLCKTLSISLPRALR